MRHILRRLVPILVCIGILAPPFGLGVRAQFGQRLVARIYVRAIERTLSDIIAQLPAALFFGAMDSIGRDLNLKLEELKKLEPLREEFQNDLMTALREAGVNLVGKVGEDPEQLEKHLADLRGKFSEVVVKLNQKYEDKLSGLLSPQQLQRLRQVAWQFGGARSLLDPRVAAALELSDMQKTKLQELLKDSEDQRAKAGAIGGGRRAGKRLEQLDEIRRTRDGKAKELLTPAQQAKLKEFYGSEIDVEALRTQTFEGLLKFLQKRPDSQ